MTSAYRAWTGPARTMALAVDAAVSAARAGDADEFTAATAELNQLDRGQLTVLLGAVTRDVVEQSHPDGLDSDDAEQILQNGLRSAAWYPPLDRDSMVRALTGALGVSEIEDGVVVDAPAVLAHGLLLICERLNALQQPLAPVLNAALAELLRAQTVELP